MWGQWTHREWTCDMTVINRIKRREWILMLWVNEIKCVRGKRECVIMKRERKHVWIYEGAGHVHERAEWKREREREQRWQSN